MYAAAAQAPPTEINLSSALANTIERVMDSVGCFTDGYLEYQAAARLVVDGKSFGERRGVRALKYPRQLGAGHVHRRRREGSASACAIE